MTVATILLISYVTSVFAKFFYLNIAITTGDTHDSVRLQNAARSPFLVMLTLSPFASFIVDESVVKKKGVLQLSEALGWISGILLALSLSNIFADHSTIDALSGMLFFLYFFITIVMLLYLAVYDLMFLSIPVRFTLQIVFFSVIAQLIILLLRSAGIVDADLFNALGTLDNIFGFALLYLGTYLLILATSEKGIGAGDADVNGFIGLQLGISASVVFALSTIFIGSGIGIIYAIIKKRLKGLIIPMVPLICLGYTIAIGYSDEIFSIIFFTQ
jgi:prepilin signal peptidase PulO-like enzyme (type II secretory pathway)